MTTCRTRHVHANFERPVACEPPILYRLTLSLTLDMMKMTCQQRVIRMSESNISVNYLLPDLLMLLAICVQRDLLT